MNEIKKIELVAAYIRVSSQEQKLHGLSLDAQKMKLQDYADKNNMKIVEWYMDEGVSGRKLIRKRPELQRMIQDAENGAFEKIISESSFLSIFPSFTTDGKAFLIAQI